MLTPITIDNRIRGFIGRPPAGGRRPAVIHLHERYGIVQHTTDLAQKLLDAGYVTIVPDLFSRFIGNREALAAGDARCELSDEEVLQDVDTVAGYLRALPDVDASRIRASRPLTQETPVAAPNPTPAAPSPASAPSIPVS